MSNPNSGHSGDESLENMDETPGMESLITRPHYAKLRADYQHVRAKGLLKKPLSRKQLRAFVDAQMDFQDAMLELLPRSGHGRVVLDPADTRTEHARVTNAAITLHDWLRLYAEVIKQPPPKVLKEIQGALCERRDELDRRYPPADHQPD
jgi:hypothetical protein